MSSSPADGSTLDASPRTPTRAAAKQSWRELPVRVWMLVTLGVAVVVGVVATRSIQQGLSDAQLRRDGVKVDALIEKMPDGSRNLDRAVARSITLSFVLPGETERRTIQGTTSPMPGRLSERETIPIWIDPKDTGRWTDRVDAVRWTSLLAVPILLLPAVLILAGLMWRRRVRYLRTWRDGAATRGTVLDVQTSALTPGQKVLKVSIPDGDGTRVVAVTHPDRLGTRQRGDAVDLVADTKQAVLAAAYT